MKTNHSVTNIPSALTDVSITNQEITVIEKQLPKYLSLEVKDPTTLKEASTYLVSAKKEYKTIKEDMDNLLAPFKEGIDGVKEKYDPRLKALKSVIDALTGQTTQYQTRLINKRQEAEQAIASRIKEGKGNLSFDTAVKRIGELDVVEKKVETDAGGMSFINTKKFEVVDLSQLPLSYHLANEVLIRSKMKEGVELPGVRYYVEQVPRNSR